MEQTRMLLAIVLSFLILLVWQFFFTDKQARPPAPATTNTQAPLATDPEKRVPTSPMIPPAPLGPLAAAVPTERDARTVLVETPLYVARISERGAAVLSFKLKEHKEAVGPDAPLKEMVSPGNAHGTFQSSLTAWPEMATAIYTLAIDQETIRVEERAQAVSFLLKTPAGVVIEKRYTFSPDNYKFSLAVTVANRSGAALTDALVLSMVDTIPTDKGKLGFTGPSVMIDGHIEEIKLKNLAEQNRHAGDITWAAFQDRYFMTAVIPEIAQPVTVRFLQPVPDFLETQVIAPQTTIAVGEQETFLFEAYLGPKSVSVLRAAGNQLERVVNFGWFDFMARPFLWVMNAMYKVIPNYGVAIILLTVLIKIVLWPLGNKSYKSMSQMKKMQPLMADVRERYKNDKQRMNQELMGLYKTYKVNPLGGCLPMLAQIPVFFAFYRMLYQAVELRHAPFFGWINDLSAPDRLFDFGVSIPFMEPPYGIPVLTIIMGATMLWQQKLQPPMGDPAQAKMMMIMPVVFTVIFVNFSSGLVLYWLFNNILSILQQYYVSKKTA